MMSISLFSCSRTLVNDLLLSNQNQTFRKGLVKWKSHCCTSSFSLSPLYPINQNELPVGARSISTSWVLFAEPLKKKKKMDPAIIKAREEKRKRKIEKQIKKLEKMSRRLKPLEECEIPTQILDEPKQRERRLPALSTDEANERWQLQKEWARFKYGQNKQNFLLFDRIIQSQENALAQLRLESEDLYVAACDYDEALLPYTVRGPVETPPIESYKTPDGDYIDISKKWE